ncbi:MAG: IS3 family transposase [Dehalococcoidia bacterium]
MSFRLVQELAADGVRVAVACRMLRVSSSGYYEWRGRPPSPRALADQALTVQIKEIHAASRGAYGAPGIHSELRLGRGLRCGRKRVARLMRNANLCGVYASPAGVIRQVQFCNLRLNDLLFRNNTTSAKTRNCRTI